MADDNRWRDAAHELPPEGQDVLVAFGSHDFEIRHLVWCHAIVSGGGYRDTAMWYPGGRSLTSAFWMPLPAGPSGMPDMNSDLDHRGCDGDCEGAREWERRERFVL
jgi:hypothetical protein